MTIQHLDLTSYLRQEEGQFFDRKSLFHGPPGMKKQRSRAEVRDEVASYVAAFANADGGVLILGQEDDKTVTGHRYPADVLEDLVSVPVRRLTPPQAPGWVQELEGHQVLVFSVPTAPRAVMVHGDGFPRRVKDTVIQDSEEAINAIKRRGVSFGAGTGGPEGGRTPAPACSSASVFGFGPAPRSSKCRYPDFSGRGK